MNWLKFLFFPKPTPKDNIDPDFEPMPFMERLYLIVDNLHYQHWKRFKNGNVELQTVIQAVIDTTDSLDAIDSAVQDGDYSSALSYINAARESLKDHIDTLRGLL